MSTSPLALPLIGHALAFLRDKPGFLDATRRQYGDCVRLNIGGPTWLLNRPDDVKHVLVDHASLYEKTPKLTSRRGRALSGDGLHTATGAEHVWLRRMVQPLFHRQIVSQHSHLVQTIADEMLDSWHDGDTIDLLTEMMRWSQRVMIRALFGESFVDPNGQFAAAVTARRAYIEHFFTSNLPSPEYWPLPVVRRYERGVVHLHRVIGEQIHLRRRGEVGGDDWLSMLVRSTARDGTPLTDTQIRDEAITLTSTGYETVAAGLTWTGHLLALHPDVQSTLGASAPDAPTFDMVLNESMRLYPPTWLYVRVAIDSDVLPSGASIAPGEKIYLSPYTMHRHPQWYATPTRFNVGHFSEAAVRDRPRFAFYPFGGGARQCIGEPFARLEMSILLAAMVKHFQFLPVDSHTVSLRPSIVLEPRGGLRVRLRRRPGN